MYEQKANQKKKSPDKKQFAVVSHMTLVSKLSLQLKKNKK